MNRQLRLRGVPDKVLVSPLDIRGQARNLRILANNLVEYHQDLSKKRAPALTKAAALGEMALDLDRLLKQIDSLEALVAEKGGRS